MAMFVSYWRSPPHMRFKLSTVEATRACAACGVIRSSALMPATSDFAIPSPSQRGIPSATVQTLMGHHSVAFTMDQYADAWPEQIASAGEAAARLLLPSGSQTVAAGGRGK